MRILILPSALLLFSAGLHAQQAHHGLVPQRIAQLRSSGAPFDQVELFHTIEPTEQRDALWRNEVREATVLSLDGAVLHTLLAGRPERVAITLPASDGEVTLELEASHPLADEFSVVTASTGHPVAYAPGLHYQGAVEGDPTSLVALSVFEGEVMGMISTSAGDLTLGKLGGDASGAHILYRISDLREQPSFTCGVVEDGAGYTHEELEPQGDDRTVKCVRFYWEVNYDIFVGKGSVTNTTNYVTGLFNQSQVLYNNDGISVSLLQVYVWNVASPYTQTATGDLLDQFGVTRTSFNGDLAHLLGYAGGGGIAWLNTLCSSSTSSRMAYSDIGSSYSNVPTYSWSVEVVTHEQGHNMGSRHTHACSWNGNNTAIDGCGPTAGYTEGSCATGPLPTGTGGTIMSYCHLVGSVGINFNNGFGPQPQTVIVNRINSATCLLDCSTATCSSPTGLVASNITTASATLSWAAVTGASSYTLQWKATSASTWNTITGLTSTSYALTGLTGGTSYQFKVLTVCSGGSSAYATAVSFTTSTAACGVPQNLAASSITASSASISWSAVSGAVSYTLQWKPTSSSTWTTQSSLTTTTYALSGLTAGTNYDVHVLTACAGSSSAYSGTVSFATTTAQSCSDNYEPNNTNGGARTIAANGTITGRIASATDVDWFKFANTSATPNIRVTLSNLPANYNMKLYRASGLLATSANAGTTNEQITYYSSTVSSNYKVNVYGASGAYNATACYTLTVQLSNTTFPSGNLPDGIDEVRPEATGGVQVFPNPANALLNIIIPAGEETAQVDLLDAMGRTVNTLRSQALNADQRFLIDISTMESGLYFVRSTRGMQVDVQRVIIQH